MITNRTLILPMALVFALYGCAATDPSGATGPGDVRVVPASEVQWEALNPLRGDKSPRAGTLWGDRGAPVPSGFLVKFVDGFSSPPHIHPVTYRGVVVSGQVHNDTVEAEETWLPPGSFWTQPAGQVHITAARGPENVAYIEIEEGPYRVLPAESAFDSGEEAVKWDPSRIAWVDVPGASTATRAPSIATLPGNPEDDGVRRALVELPAGFEGAIRSRGASLHVVVILGRTRHHVPGKTEATTLGAGSYFGSEGGVAHRVTCDAEADCLLYVRTTGEFEVRSE